MNAIKNTMKETIKDFCTERYQPGEYVYPEAVTRSCDTSENDAVQTLDQLCAEGLLKKLIYVVCPSCGMPATIYYDEQIQLPEEVHCIRCDEDIETACADLRFAYKRKLL